MENKIITMQSLAKVFGVDRSAISRFVKKHDLRDLLITVRSANTGFRQTKALREKDAVYLCELRRNEGFPVGELFFDDGYSISDFSYNSNPIILASDEEEKKRKDFELFKEKQRKHRENIEELRRIVL